MARAKRTFKWHCLDCGNYGFATEYENSKVRIPSKCPACGSINLQVVHEIRYP